MAHLAKRSIKAPGNDIQIATDPGSNFMSEYSTNIKKTTDANKKVTASSLYEKLQENKTLQQDEFYEESKSELSGRNLTDEDAKFLSALQDSKKQTETAIKNQTDAAIHEFRIRHELLTREIHFQEEQLERVEPVKASLAKISSNVKISAQQVPSEASIKSKRNLLGIKPKANK